MEFYCSLHRKFRNREISEENLKIALSNFNESLTRFVIEPVSNLVLKEAEKIILLNANKYAIRTLDSIHVATFNLISESNWHFVATDKSLLYFMKNLNTNIIEINI